MSKQVVRKKNLCEEFVRKITDDILEGKYPIGAPLPPERELADHLGISRAAVRNGMAVLAADGIVEVRPRQGAFVVDYKYYGRLPMLDAMFSHTGQMDRALYNGLLDARNLLEIETARLAALNRKQTHIDKMRKLLQPDWAAYDDETFINQHFDFHIVVAVAGGNPFYPLVINSLQVAYRDLLQRYLEQNADRHEIYTYHGRLFDAIERQSVTDATEAMARIIDHRLKD
jgi:DNA-binding FadR family transcriptional regulator